MARLYSNENFPLPAVKELRKLGHDVVTIMDMGQGGKMVPDDEVLRQAIGSERAVLTLNRRDFISLHREEPTHKGIVVCSSDNNFPAVAMRIHIAITAEDTLDSKLIRVHLPG